VTKQPGYKGQPANLITAVVLFVDLQGSVNYSTSLSVWEYDKLINAYQHVLAKVVAEMKARYCIKESAIAGDELKAFFYDPGDVKIQNKMKRIRKTGGIGSDEYDELKKKLRATRNRLIYGALRTAIQAKHNWLSYQLNVDRIHAKQNPIELGCGIHSGRVIYARRGDGEKRIEGYMINYAKRIEGTSRFGKYSQIALSRSAYEVLRNIRVGHSMLKQRIFFKRIDLPPDAMKGLFTSERIHEVTFFHRLKGVKLNEEQVVLFRQIFETDPTNFWAYSNLINYLFYDFKHVDDAEQLAESERVAEYALYSNPAFEKIYYDLGSIQLKLGNFETARQYGLMALDLNDEFDLAYSLLWEIEENTDADPERMLDYASRAVSLSPGSALNHLSLAKALSASGKTEQARIHLDKVVELYPSYADEDDVKELRSKLWKKKKSAG